MTSWFSVGLIVFVFLGILFFYLHKRNLLPSWLSNLLSNPKKQVAKIKSHTEQELLRAKELQAILEAKQELVQAKAFSSALRRDIAEINESNVSLITQKQLLRRRGDGKSEAQEN